MTKRNTYTKEFKFEAVRLLDSSDKPGADIARELGIRRNMLYKWQEQLSDKGEDSNDDQLLSIFNFFRSNILMSLNLIKIPLVKTHSDESENMSDGEIIRLMKKIIEAYTYDVERHVLLVSTLRLTGKIDIIKTMSMLDKAEKDGSCSKVKKLSRVYDVLGALKEDLKDGFMEPDDDELLDESLKNYFSGHLGQLL